MDDRSDSLACIKRAKLQTRQCTLDEWDIEPTNKCGVEIQERKDALVQF